MIDFTNWKYEPYPYQIEAVEKSFDVLRSGGKPVIDAATGAGKSIIISIMAEVGRKAGKRVLNLVHNLDLVKNNSDEFIAQTRASIDVGICCAGLGRNEVDRPVTFASIGTFANSLSGAIEAGLRWDLVIIDECHRVNAADGQYKDVLGALADTGSKFVGLSATPYRVGYGMVYGQEDSFFTELAYRICLKTLISMGNLTRLVSLGSGSGTDVSGRYVNGRVDQKESSEKLHDAEGAIVDDIKRNLIDRDRKSAIVFCPLVKDAQRLCEIFDSDDRFDCRVITGKAGKNERSEVKNFLELGDIFYGGRIRIVFNVDLLTTGVSINRVDAIVFCRSMDSAGLMVQCAGRGTRLHDDKEYCLVLDYGRNIERLGYIDDPKVKGKPKGGGEAVMKVCGARVVGGAHIPGCFNIDYASARVCSACGEVYFDPDEAADKLAASADKVAALSDDIVYDVQMVRFEVRPSSSGKDLIRVCYDCGEEVGLIYDYICLLHGGIAKQFAYEKVSLFFKREEDFAELTELKIDGKKFVKDLSLVVEFLNSEVALDYNDPERVIHEVERIEGVKDGSFFRINQMYARACP